MEVLRDCMKDLRPTYSTGPQLHHRRTLRDARGFTILEVTMAAFILVLGIVTSISVIQRGFGYLDTARNLNVASQIMENEIETLRTQSWATVSAYSTSAVSVALPSSFAAISSVANRFTLTRTATLVHSGMVRIDLTVTWKNYDGRTLSRTYTTYVAQNGLYD